MVSRLNCTALVILALALPFYAVSTQVTDSDWHYRQAAWSFYLQQPAQALEILQLAPVHDERTQLLEAGLYLQLEMPQHAAGVLDKLLSSEVNSPGALPLALRNIALLQFSRYQLELGNKTTAKRYLSKVNITADNSGLGQQQLLSQLVHWPDIDIPAQPAFDVLLDQPEMPYIISNQALLLAQQQQSEKALQWLVQLQQHLKPPTEQNFWQVLFSGQWRLFSSPQGFVFPEQERLALADYIMLTQAQLHIERQEYAAADAVLTDFAADSVLSGTALQLYSHILTEQRHIPMLLAVLQQQIKQQPLSYNAWQAATRIGEQLERSAQMQDALAAYHWAEQYYQQQTELINQQAQPVQVGQLPNDLSQWQLQQLSNDNTLHRLQQDILALQQQLADAPQRQQRLVRLQQVAEYKLSQQQQLLRNQLPELLQRKQALQLQFTSLLQQIEQAEQQPMTMALWQGEPYSQLSRLERAEQRLLLLQQTELATDNYQQRLQRLRGLLQWQYSDSASERRWQRQQQIQQVKQVLESLQQKLFALQQQGDKTERLQRVLQRLNQMSEQQQQLNLSLLSKQQQLLALLNQQLQQRRQQHLMELTQLQRHNKESMARVMERVLLMADSADPKVAL